MACMVYTCTFYPVCVLELFLATYATVVQHDTNLELKMIRAYHPMLELNMSGKLS